MSQLHLNPRRSSWSSTALLSAAVLMFTASPAAAHFLWAVVESAPKPKLALSFREEPEGAADAVPLSRLESARAWDAKGQSLTLSHGTEALVAPLAADGAVGAAQQTYGIVDRDEDGVGAFMLEYYAKAASTLADAGTNMKLGFEVFARREGSELVLALRRGDTKVADASVKIHTPRGDGLDRASDANGEVRLDVVQAGLYGVRARWIEARAGTAGEKKYGEVRHYSTLTFSVPESMATNAGKSTTSDAVNGAPVAASAKKADPAAYALLKNAHDSRQVLPVDYPGFQCAIVLREGDESWDGKLTYRRQGETELAFTGLDDKRLEWVRGQVLNLTGHRRGGDFAKGDGKYPLELGPDDHNPYGRLIIVNDASQSSYRVRDNKVHEVTRTMDGSKFTISVIDTMEGDTGKYLANHFVVSYRDAETGTLQKFEGYRDSYAHVESLWLPTGRTVITVADEVSPTVRTIRLKGHTKLDPSVAAQEASARD